MTNKEKNIIKNLQLLILEIIDAKEKKNFNEKNCKIALVDILKLLNRVYSNICELKNCDFKKVFNNYQQYFFVAINNANKKVKVPLIKINSNLWRIYLFTLFKNKNKEKLLSDLTGWDSSSLLKESFTGITEDMKIMLLSLVNINKK